MKFIFIFFMPLFFSEANVNKNLKVEKKAYILNELRVPFDQRVKRIKEKNEPGVFVDLVAVVEASKYSLQAKWNAVLTLGKVFPKRSLPYLKEWSQSRLWFLRNASLLGLEKANGDLARKLALNLLNDKSLIIRTSAVQVLSRTGKIEDLEILKKSYYSRQNFYKKQSLWVRHHLIHAIAKLGQKKSKKFLLKALYSQDLRVQKAALSSLEELEPEVAARFKKFKFSKRKTAWLQLSGMKI